MATYLITHVHKWARLLANWLQCCSFPAFNSMLNFLIQYFFRTCAWLIIASTHLIWLLWNWKSETLILNQTYFFLACSVFNCKLHFRLMVCFNNGRKLLGWFLCPPKKSCLSIMMEECIKPCWCPYHIVPHIFIVNVRLSDRLACIFIIFPGALQCPSIQPPVRAPFSPFSSLTRFHAWLQHFRSFSVDLYGRKYSWNDDDEDRGKKDPFRPCGRPLKIQTNNVGCVRILGLKWTSNLWNKCFTKQRLEID